MLTCGKTPPATLICTCIAHSIFINMREVMGGQLPSKAHVNFREFTAVFGVACKLSCAVVNLNFQDNLQCRLLTKVPLFMQWKGLTEGDERWRPPKSL